MSAKSNRHISQRLKIYMSLGTAERLTGQLTEVYTLKHLVSLLLIVVILSSCGKKQVKGYQIESVENIAVSFFVDSLLYQQGLFTRVTHGSLVGERITPPFESNLYSNGLFKGYTLLASKWASSLTRPFIDSTVYSNPVFEYEDDDLELFRKIEAQFKSESSKADSVLINIKEPLVEFELSNDNLLNLTNNSLVMVVHRALFVEDKYYVQINFLDYFDLPFFEEYVLYIVLNKTQEVDYWFFR